MSVPGDVGFACQPGFINWWIKFAQRRKYGKNSPAAKWNHTFMVTSYQGDLVQAVSSGMEKGHLADYAGQDIELRRPPYAAGEAANAVAATEELWADHSRYGMLTIASVALSLLTGTKLRFGLDGTEICSGAVSYALTRANVDVGQDAEFNTPADVYSYALAQKWAVV